MSENENLTEKEKEKNYREFVENLIIMINRAKTKVLLYPKNHPEVKAIINEVLNFLTIDLKKSESRTLIFKPKKIIVDGFLTIDDKDYAAYFSANLIQKGIEGITFERGIDFDSLYKILYLISIEQEKLSKIDKRVFKLNEIVGIKIKEIDYLKFRELHGITATGKFDDKYETSTGSSPFFNFLKVRKGFSVVEEDMESLVGDFKDAEIPENLQEVFKNVTADEFNVLRGEEYSGILMDKVEGRIGAFFIWATRKINEVTSEAEENERNMKDLSELFFSLSKELRAKIVISSVDEKKNLPEEILEIFKYSLQQYIFETIFQIKLHTTGELFDIGQKIVAQIQGAVDNEKPVSSEISEEDKRKNETVTINIPEATMKEIEGYLSDTEINNHKMIIYKDLVEKAEMPDAIINALDLTVAELENHARQKEYDKFLSKYGHYLRLINAKDNFFLNKHLNQLVHGRVVKNILLPFFVDALINSNEKEMQDIALFAAKIKDNIHNLLTLELVNYEDRKTRKKIIDYLVLKNEPCFDLALEMLKSEDYRVVRNIITIVKESRRTDVIDAICDLIFHEEEHIKDEALSAIGRIQTDMCVDYLLTFYRDKTQTKERHQRCFEYICISKNPKVLPILNEALNEREVDNYFWERKELAITALKNFVSEETKEILNKFIKTKHILHYKRWNSLKNHAKNALAYIENK